MKAFAVLVIVTIVVLGTWLSTGSEELKRNVVLEEKLLELSTPINGRIDSEFLKANFSPAYE